MGCTHIYDFINNSKITLPRPNVIKRHPGSRRDIVRPNHEAEQLVLHHLKMLEALAADKLSKATEH